ncbi:Fusaric acid resistance protein family protein [Caballeronia catudaia]|uniref:Fusaric acid resistance protein family protein n=1 Tax=Caballeronia catudaia TaxID=1777136 RepID=A0A157ZLA9_9BURK|nr:FUSC family protein [Caballeronia catudaia]SAK46312.1 Fusaric acid resistance protein family protein [Caballeronia catudaia]
MTAIIRTRRRLHAFFGAPEARRLLRTLMSCAISYGAARLAALPEGYWALITTLVIVTQPSLTQAVDTARDQIIGAFIGAVAGVLGIVAMQHGAAPLAVFTIALLPLAALSAKRPAFRLACVTLVIVVLIPASPGSPYERPMHRVLEILIGAASSFVVSALWPNRALDAAHRSVADTLRSLGQLIGLYLSGDHDDARAQRLETQSTDAQKALDDALKEAEREHIIVLVQNRRSDAIDKAAPFLRRLHSDALFLAKAVSRPDRDACAARLGATGRELQALFEALASVLASNRQDDAKLARVRSSAGELKAMLTAQEPTHGAQQVAQFVVGLIVADLDALIATIYPLKEQSA